MPTKFDLERPFFSYARVRALYSFWARNKRWQLRSVDVRDAYVNIGCGPHGTPDFVNLDRLWKPGVDICWDIKRRLPFRSESCCGIFTEHCLEHLKFEKAQRAIREFHRVLKPGSAVRIVVPDGELYLRLYCRAIQGEEVTFPWQKEEDDRTPMMFVNNIFRNFGHLYTYDAPTMARLMKEAGFQDIRQAGYREGRDPKLLIDQEWRAHESLYMEGTA